jgi:uncharacterized protein YacL
MKTESGRGDPRRPTSAYRHLPQLTLAGGLAFWAANFATSLLPIAAEYRVAQSIAYVPMVLVESLAGGLVVGLMVSMFLLRLYGTLPSESPIVKAVLLSAVALIVFTVMTWGAGSLAAESTNDSGDFLIGIVLNVPRFAALGVAVGYYHQRLAGWPMGAG